MRLLVLGWKPGFSELLPRLGVDYVVLVGIDELREYGRPATPGGRLLRVRDVSDVARTLAALARAGLGPGSFDRVYTDHEFAIIPAALLARYLGGTGMPVSTAVLARDKWLQKQAVAKAGIRVPEHVLVPEPEAAHEQLAAATYPALLKPISSASGRHTSYVRDQDEACAALTAVDLDAVDTDAFVLERVVTGRELHLDGLVHQGRLAFLSVGRYRRNVLAARYDATVGSLILDPRRHPELYARARHFTARTLAAIELADAAFHLEAFDVHDDLVFSECGARTGGSLLVQAVKAKFGVDLREAGLDIAIGRRPRGAGVPVDAEIGWTYLPAPLGRVLRLPSAEAVLQQTGVRHAQTSAGQPFPIQHGLVGVAQKAGLALVEAPTEDGLDHRIGSLVTWFSAQSRTDPTDLPPATRGGYRVADDIIGKLSS